MHLYRHMHITSSACFTIGNKLFNVHHISFGGAVPASVPEPNLPKASKHLEDTAESAPVPEFLKRYPHLGNPNIEPFLEACGRAMISRAEMFVGFRKLAFWPENVLYSTWALKNWFRKVFQPPSTPCQTQTWAALAEPTSTSLFFARSAPQNRNKTGCRRGSLAAFGGSCVS